MNWQIGFAIATSALLFLTLLPLSRSPVWWVRCLDFPRLQLFVAAMALLSCQLVGLVGADGLAGAGAVKALDGVLLAVNLACLGYHGAWIVAYTPLVSPEVQGVVEGLPGRRLRVLVSNVLMSNRGAKRLIALVRKEEPDLLVTLETDRYWESQLDSLQPDYPHALKCPLDNLYGMHVYSRWPLEEASVKFLVEDGVPSMHALIRLDTETLVEAHFLHPAPPSPTENKESTERDTELSTVARQVACSKYPVIVTGDLNDVAWSRTTRRFRKLSGLLDPRIGRGMFNTFHARHWFLRWPLDHLFHSHHFRLRKVKRLPSIGSDHFPLLTELVLP